MKNLSSWLALLFKSSGESFIILKNQKLLNSCPYSYIDHKSSQKKVRFFSFATLIAITIVSVSVSLTMYLAFPSQPPAGAAPLSSEQSAEDTSGAPDTSGAVSPSVAEPGFLTLLPDSGSAPAPDSSPAPLPSQLSAPVTQPQSSQPTPAPAPPTSLPAPTAVLYNTPSTPFNQNTVVISIGGSGVTHYKYKLDAGSFGPETYISQSVTLSNLSDGIHVLYVIGKNSEGTWQAESSASVFAWSVDTVPPAAPTAVLFNTPQVLTNQRSANITVGGSGVTYYKYKLDAGSFGPETYISQSIVLSNLSDGTHVFYVIGRNSAGTWQSELSASVFVWTIDVTAPIAVLTSALAPVTSQKTGSISVGGTGLTHYKYKLDSGSFGAETAVSQNISLSGLGEGSHTVSVIGKDTTGNWQSESSASVFAWTVDTVKPVVSTFLVVPASTNAVLQWNTNEDTSAEVFYGLTQNYTHSTTVNTSADSSSHTTSLSGLQSCATYYYLATSNDAGQNEAVQTGTFTTLSCTGSSAVQSQSNMQISYLVGGTLHLLDSGSNGITLNIPAYFAGQDANFQIKKLDKSAIVNSVSMPLNFSMAGDYYYRLQALTDLATLLPLFDNALRIRIAYDRNNLSGIAESSLVMMRRDGTGWSGLSDCTLNTSAQFIECSTTLFSDFTIFGATPVGLRNVSDTLSDSDLGVVANHTIKYTSSNAVAASETIRIIFDASGDAFGGFGDIVISDITFTGATLVSSCTASANEVTFSATSTVSGHEGITFTVCSGDTVVSGAKTIQVSNNRITNPNSESSFEIVIRSGSDDSNDEIGKTRVAIINDITMTASVGSTLTFTIIGVASGQSAANGESGNTDIATTATSIPWGSLTSGAAKVARQDLTVATNATNGFIVTLNFDQALTSAAGDTIDFFKDGSTQASSTAWASPADTTGSVNTYGHMGFTSEDSDIGSNRTASEDFGIALYAGDATSTHVVFDHTGSADGTTADKGATRIGFKIESASRQEGGVYSAQLTYVVTPTF